MKARKLKLDSDAQLIAVGLFELVGLFLYECPYLYWIARKHKAVLLFQSMLDLYLLGLFYLNTLGLIKRVSSLWGLYVCI